MTDRPIVPDVRSIDVADMAVVQAYINCKRSAFVWDAKQAGFSESQATFLYERYQDRGMGPFGF